MRFMVLTSSLGELMEDQILQYCYIVLNINDRAFTYRNIYIEKVKRKKNMFDSLFVNTFRLQSFFFNAKVFYRNYFSMRNNYDR